MFVDIHTHKKNEINFSQVRNLTFSEVKGILSSSQNGFCSVGFYPWFADKFTNIDFEHFTKMFTDKRLVFVGECGFDKKSKIPYEQQLFVFKQQILLSEKIKKPLIVHCVGYFNELVSLRKQLVPSQLWIIHGFRGKPELATQLLKCGCVLSFGEHFNPQSVSVTPIEKLFVETDESNKPIREIYNELATIKLCEPHKLDAGYRLLSIISEQNSL